MDDITKRDPVQIRAEDINPRYNWGRALPALGIMGVDFEERVDYRRLHRYRLARARMALEKSDLGALLVPDDREHPVLERFISIDRQVPLQEA